VPPLELVEQVATLLELVVLQVTPPMQVVLLALLQTVLLLILTIQRFERVRAWLIMRVGLRLLKLELVIINLTYQVTFHFFV
jgi:hypothetical protein